MLPLFIRKVGRFLKIQSNTAIWPTSSCDRSQAITALLRPPLRSLGTAFGSTQSASPETTVHHRHLDKLHHEFAVIDDHTVITGSFNWSPSAAHQNDETLLVIESPLLAAHFRQEVDRLWQGPTLGISTRMQRKPGGSGTQRDRSGLGSWL